MRNTINNRLNKELNQYSTGGTRDCKQPEQTTNQLSKNIFTELHSSVLSCDSDEPESILSSLIDQFDGPELSQHAALIAIFVYKEAAFLLEDCNLLTPTRIC